MTQDENIEKEMEEKLTSMQDNTQVNDDEKKLKFAKLQMPASVVDFILDHYGFFDLVELNTIVLYIMKTLGHMENDGFKFAVHKTENGKIEAYQLDFHELIAKFRIQLAQSMTDKKTYEPEIKVEHKEKDEKNSV